MTFDASHAAISDHIERLIERLRGPAAVIVLLVAAGTLLSGLLSCGSQVISAEDLRPEIGTLEPEPSSSNRILGGARVFEFATGDGQTDSRAFSLTVLSASDPPAPFGGLANECASPAPEWIWCDDFEHDRLGSYFEVADAAGRMAREAGTGVDGSTGLRARYGTSQPSAGNLKVAFGFTPSGFTPVDGGTQKYRDIYWRQYIRTEAGWSGDGPGKLSRAIVFATSSWAEAAIGHLWTGRTTLLVADPVRGTDASGNLLTTGYNDFDHFTWLGASGGSTELFSAANADTWFCVEAHMKLNDAGTQNGVLEFWIDAAMEARITGLNFVGSYGDYGINAIFFENYWNNASPVVQERYMDNIVVSTQRIGCGD